MNRNQHYLAIWAVVWTGLSSAAGLAQDPLPGAGLSREQQERVLLEAKILKTRELDIGVTGSRLASLSDGNFTHDAHIQTVDVHKWKTRVGRKTEIDWRDFWGFNVAAGRDSDPASGVDKETG